jgi:hypothetical protein
MCINCAKMQIYICAKFYLMCACAYGIIQIGNKTTAVQGSANSHAPAQVIRAPTQRDYPAPQGYYIRFATVLQEGKCILARLLAAIIL